MLRRVLGHRVSIRVTLLFYQITAQYLSTVSLKLTPPYMELLERPRITSQVISQRVALWRWLAP